MNITLKLTLDGLIEALRWKALERQQDEGRPASADAVRKAEKGETPDNGK